MKYDVDFQNIFSILFAFYFAKYEKFTTVLSIYWWGNRRTDALGENRLGCLEIIGCRKAHIKREGKGNNIQIKESNQETIDGKRIHHYSLAIFFTSNL